MRMFAALFFLTASLLHAHRPAEWRQLFNGRDLKGWKHVGKGSMTVENGFIQTSGGLGLLYWDESKLGDCVVRVVFRTRGQNANSGVFVRIPIVPLDVLMPTNYGYEVGIDGAPATANQDEYRGTGALYTFTKPKERPAKPGTEWNTMDITLDGPRTKVAVNGVEVTDYTEGEPTPEKKLDTDPERGTRPNYGYIGLENHSEADVVLFKEIAIRPLRGASN